MDNIYDKDMNSLILTVRALSVEFARRLILPIFIVGASALVLLTGLAIWLTSINGWWGILLGIVILWAIIFLVAATIVKVILKKLNPTQSSSQKTAVKNFVDKLQAISETIQTPKVFIVGRLVADTLNKNDNGLVRTMSNHTLTTKRDFDDIRKSFESNK